MPTFDSPLWINQKMSIILVPAAFTQINNSSDYDKSLAN